MMWTYKSITLIRNINYYYCYLICKLLKDFNDVDLLLSNSPSCIC